MTNLARLLYAAALVNFACVAALVLAVRGIL
jgi:hypothetical protein